MGHQKCEQDSFVISIEDALKKDNSIFLDVRDLHEKPIINIQNYCYSSSSPLSDLQLTRDCL